MFGAFELVLGGGGGKGGRGGYVAEEGDCWGGGGGHLGLGFKCSLKWLSNRGINWK